MSYSTARLDTVRSRISYVLFRLMATAVLFAVYLLAREVYDRSKTHAAAEYDATDEAWEEFEP